MTGCAWQLCRGDAPACAVEKTRTDQKIKPLGYAEERGRWWWQPRRTDASCEVRFAPRPWGLIQSTRAGNKHDVGVI